MKFYYSSGVSSLSIYKETFICLKNDLLKDYNLETDSSEDICKLVMSPYDFVLLKMYDLQIKKFNSQINN